MFLYSSFSFTFFSKCKSKSKSKSRFALTALYGLYIYKKHGGCSNWNPVYLLYSETIIMLPFIHTNSNNKYVLSGRFVYAGNHVTRVLVCLHLRVLGSRFFFFFLKNVTRQSNLFTVAGKYKGKASEEFVAR